MNKQEWLKERKTYLGGSDIGAVIGINKYKTALDIYLEKTADNIVEVNNSATYWGNTLEDVAQEYSKRANLPVEIESKLLRHSEHEFIACNIDRWVDSGRYILECKTAGFMMAKEWGEEGIFDIPDSYKCQVAYYAAITGVPKVDIAVLIGGQDFRIYTYIADEVFQGKLIKAACKFWNEYILKGIPPKAKTTGDAAKLYPKANGLEVRADNVVLEKVSVLKELKTKEKLLAHEIEAIQLDVKGFMKDGELLVDSEDHVLASWRNGKTRERFNAKKLANDNAELYSQYLEETKVSRTFLVK